MMHEEWKLAWKVPPAWLLVWGQSRIQHEVQS